MLFEPRFHREKSLSRLVFTLRGGCRLLNLTLANESLGGLDEPPLTADVYAEHDAARYHILNERLTTCAHKFPDTQADASTAQNFGGAGARGLAGASSRGGGHTAPGQNRVCLPIRPSQAQ